MVRTILKGFKGVMGNSDSEIVRGIVVAYLSEKTYLKDLKDKMSKIDQRRDE